MEVGASDSCALFKSCMRLRGARTSSKEFSRPAMNSFLEKKKKTDKAVKINYFFQLTLFSPTDRFAAVLKERELIFHLFY